MRGYQEDTPPSSVNGDDITGMEEEGDGQFFLDMDEHELQYGDEYMEEITEADLEEMEEEMQPPEDHSSLVFKQHNGSVFCCDLHPSGKLAVTGGEDDKAFVWSVETGDVVMDCTGHKDSVIFVGFSFDGAYLATADMSGVIKVWKYMEGEQQATWPLVFEYEAGDLTWGLWHFGTRVLCFGTVAGDIFVFKVPSGDTKVLQGHNVRVECGKLFQDGVRLAAGYTDGCVKLWDLKTSTVLHTVAAGPHEIRVTDIDVHPANSLVASISSDGKVVLTTSANGKVVGQFEVDNDLEAVAFSKDPQLGYFALGTLNGSISIWDSTRQMMRHSCSNVTDEDKSGVTKITWVKNHLITGCLDGSIRVYEGRSGDKALVLTGHLSEILDLCYNPQQSLILTTSDDGTARIFKYEINKDKE